MNNRISLSELYTVIAFSLHIIKNVDRIIIRYIDLKASYTHEEWISIYT